LQQKADTSSIFKTVQITIFRFNPACTPVPLNKPFYYNYFSTSVPGQDTMGYWNLLKFAACYRLVFSDPCFGLYVPPVNIPSTLLKFGPCYSLVFLMDERIIIINGPNVYMGQDDAGNIHYKGHWKGGGA
jgi:hypothetical protein